MPITSGDDFCQQFGLFETRRYNVLQNRGGCDKHRGRLAATAGLGHKVCLRRHAANNGGHKLQ